MSRDYIKPCPFCGGPGVLVKTRTSYDANILSSRFKCGCPECDIFTYAAEVTAYIDNNAQVVPYYKGVCDVIDAWNERVGED